MTSGKLGMAKRGQVEGQTGVALRTPCDGGTMVGSLGVRQEGGGADGWLVSWSLPLAACMGLTILH